MRRHISAGLQAKMDRAAAINAWFVGLESLAYFLLKEENTDPRWRAWAAFMDTPLSQVDLDDAVYELTQLALASGYLP